ncbi:hypothetical protein ACFU9X_29510 [Streptomyces atratus]|uniref:hypothetical protein n=1 Tax=Streptomyces atratus TaxID=1893 RepID=UPI0036C5DE22
MNEETDLRIRQTFDRLRHDGRPLTDIGQALMDAFERLMHGLTHFTSVSKRSGSIRLAPSAPGSSTSSTYWQRRSIACR